MSTTTTTKQQQQQSTKPPPLIIIGPYEHHSNILPWRELGYCTIETVQLTSTGIIDLQHLESILQQYTAAHNNRPSMIIGSFSITSNITGIVSDDIAITTLLHQYGALSVWDYATGASYLDINMNPSSPNTAAKDAIFISGHKLLGGVGTPGVLIVKKHLFSQLNPPSRSGGGTVFYVTDQHHRFLSNRIERYEGGTPNITGIWKLGLVFKLKYTLKQELLQQQQQQQQSKPQSSSLQSLDIQRAYQIQQRLKQIPNLILLDGHYEYSDNDDHRRHHKQQQQQKQQKKVPIFSFLIKCGTRFLHYNYVSALLNDLFGIQSRGGCQCAGPYVQHLLGMNYMKTNSTMEEQLIKTKDELLRPGITRLSIPIIGTTNEQEEYIIDCIEWVAQHGWKFLHVYRCNHRSGEWRHKSRPGNTTPLGINERLWLSHYQLFGNGSKNLEQELEVTLVEAKQNANDILRLVLQDQSSISQTMKMVEAEESQSSLRWYVYPKDVARYIRDGLNEVPGTMDMDNLQGALRPLAMLDDADDDKGGQINPNHRPVVAPPLPVDVNEISKKSFRFRDGDDHTGEAPLQEIADGFDDGELSDECIIFDDAADEWKPIEPFLKETGMVPETPLSPAPILDAEQEENKMEIVQLKFRDGEHHGEASLEDIVAGFDDGELSDNCQIFNEAIDEWQILTSFLGKENENKQPSTEEGDASAITETTHPPKPSSVDPDIDDDFALLDKNDQKRPQRDSSMWGKGQAQPIEPKITTYMKQDGGDEKEEKDDVESKPKRFKHVKPPPKLMKLVTNALIQWDMIEEGDRLLLGLSGGKDSLSLLHVLLEFQRKLPIHFDIEVCTIDPMTPSFGKYLTMGSVQFVAIVSSRVLTIYSLPLFRPITVDTIRRVFGIEVSLHSR